MDTETKIKNIVIELGAVVCGIANIERFKDAPSGFHPKDIYKDCKSVIVFGHNIPHGISHVNRRIVYGKALDINLFEVDRISLLVANRIEDLGATAVSLPSGSPCEYWDEENMTAKGIISMKHAAVLAGLGSLGKNTLLINKQYGNPLNIGAVLTNLDLKSDPISEDLCIENCRLCLENCPQKALDGKTANQKLCRQSVDNCNICRMICPKSVGQARRS